MATTFDTATDMDAHLTVLEGKLVYLADLVTEWLDDDPDSAA